jgi:hypothetical protein
MLFGIHRNWLYTKAGSNISQEEWPEVAEHPKDPPTRMLPQEESLPAYNVVTKTH